MWQENHTWSILQNDIFHPKFKLQVEKLDQPLLRISIKLWWKFYEVTKLIFLEKKLSHKTIKKEIKNIIKSAHVTLEFFYLFIFSPLKRDMYSVFFLTPPNLVFVKLSSSIVFLQYYIHIITFSPSYYIYIYSHY